MNKALLITHQYIEKGEDWKYRVFDFCVKHYRRNNPDSYIALVGHGELPLKSTLEHTDWHYWPSQILRTELGKGHPQLVSKGLQHIKDKGIKYVCKTRTDSLNMMPEITSFCHQELINSKKALLNTFYYENSYRLMDLFMYSHVNTQLKMFNPEKWSVSWIDDGTGPLAQNYIEDVNNEAMPKNFDLDFWKRSIKKNIKILTPSDIKWFNFREVNDPNGHILTPELEKQLLENKVENFEKYVWKHY